MTATYVMAALTIVYLGVCLAAWLLQGRLLYFPERALETTPDRHDLEYRDVEFRAADGKRLHGWFLPASEPRGVLLFCHGNAGNISHRLESARIFLDLGLSVFLFDYRGYGRSAGRPGERGLYADARGAWRHLTEEEGVAPGEIVLFGRSLGGAVAIELATRVAPRALIVESTFTSAVDLGARLYPWLPVRLLARHYYDSADRVPRITCPKLFVHSTQDEVVPYGLGKRLYRVAAPPKEFLRITGGHGDGFLVDRERYVAGLRSFLDASPPS